MSQEIKHISPVFFDYIHTALQRFMPLTKEELNALLAYCELRRFDKKKIIVEEGEVDNYLSMVVQGLVRKYIRVRKNEATLQLATEGHVIHAELSYLTRTPSTVIVETLEPTVLISIQYSKMEEALEKYPQGERLGRLILTWMYVKKDERRFTELSKTVRERFTDYLAENPHMLQRVPQKYLASYLNIKPETFSRLKHLVKNK
jgi:CRP-like cAMP-binding protein